VTQNAISEADYVDRWQQRILELDRKINDANFQLNMLSEKLDLANVVTSPADGVVIGLQTSIGSLVKGGSPVMSIASLGEGMDAIAFISAQEGKRVKPGMGALISPSTFKREEFGSIKGEVETVSQFPTTKKAMMAVLQNEHLVEFLAKKGPPITVRIRLLEDPNTYSNLAWSSSKGPRQQVTPGSLADARITVREQRPVSLILPALRKLSEGK
jgi:HlyD family secretion protein